jgi:hypothetical protein
MNPSPISTIPAKRRVRRTRRQPSSPAAAATLQVIGVEGVFYDEPLLSFTLVFNTTAEVPLVVHELDPAKWSAVYQGNAFTGYLAEVVAFDRITVTVQADAPAAGADSVSYTAAPSDVSDSSGRELAAFSDYPIG